MTKDSLLGNWLREATAVFSPAEAKEIVRRERDAYFSAIEQGRNLQDYQDSQTLKTLGHSQRLTNDATIPYTLIGQINAALLERPDLPNNINESGFQSIKFDVDEEALRNRASGIINVYIQFQGQDPKRVLKVDNPGLSHDVTVKFNQDVPQALFEALSATR